MKKLMLVLSLLVFAFTTYVPLCEAKKPYKFTCYRYVKGKPTGTWIYVRAHSKSEAEEKAYQRFKELGGRVDSARCRY